MNATQSISKDLYAQICALASDLNEALEAGDATRYQTCFAELHALYQAKVNLGTPHPFLTETLAYYTQDANQSADLYLLSLQQATTTPGEITYSKHISLAEELISLGRVDEALQHVRLGQKEARRAGDAFWVNDAARVSRSMVA